MMINTAYCLAFVLMVGLSLSCSDTAQTEILTIQHYKVPCQGESTMMCYLEKKQGQKDWAYFYDEIQGLDYAWGYVYTLEVSTENFEKPAQDGSSVVTKVQKVLKKEKVAPGTTFELPLMVEGMAMLTRKDQVWTYFNSIEVVIPEALALDSLLRKATIGVFQQDLEQSESLRLLSLK